MKINSMTSLMKFMLAEGVTTLYRGQREAGWKLDATITRTLYANPRISRIGAQAEAFITKQFNRNAHLYDSNFTQFKGSDFATLTYIQHHGAPTRLLDLTSSKFIALFFAFDGVDFSSGGKYVRIWYFDWRELSELTRTKVGIPADINMIENPSRMWKDYINENQHDVLFVLTPELNSKRSHMQSGCFLCSGNIQKSIHTIYETDYMHIVKYVDIRKSLYNDVYKLLRSVNLSHSTLYGGIDSFSKDLRNRLNFI